VIYICAHSEEGAMGLIINQPQQMRFPTCRSTRHHGRDQSIRLPPRARDFVVRNGGPVDRSRGFVLHTDDYRVESSLPVSEEICLTATVDILRAISPARGRAARSWRWVIPAGRRPARSEIVGEWLADLSSRVRSAVRYTDMTAKYDRVLASIGIDLSRLSTVAGHA
jgi:putative transcriptional regulator